MWIFEILRNLGSILRYFASAAVAVVLVWTFDEGHDALQRTFELAWPGRSIPPMAPLGWVLLGLLGLLGLFSYFIHRAIPHRVMTKAILRHHKACWQLPSGDLDLAIRDLDFARSQRRGDKDGKRSRSVQNGLDLLNAAAHFFYCSAWASIFLALGVGFVVPRSLTLPWYFTIAIQLLFIVGVVVDVRAAHDDVEAWRRFNHQPNGT